MQRVDGVDVAPWIADRLRWAKRQGWTGHVVSGVRTHGEQHRLYDEWRRGERPGPVAKPGTSNHEGVRHPRGAVDVTEPLELAAVLRGQPANWRPLVHFGAGDLPHFSASGR